MQPMMPPPSAGPVAPTKPKGRVAMVLGSVLLVGGIVLGIVLAVTGVVSVSEAVDAMQRVPVPGTGTIEIDDPGTYHVFYEEPPGLVGTSGYDFSAGDVSIVAPSGALLAISTSTTSTTTYDFGDHSGRSIGEFRADETGTYRIRTRSADVSEGGEFSFGPTGQLAVADESPLSSLWRVLLGVFGGGAMVLTGIVLLIIGGVRRSRSKQAAYVAAAPGWGGAPPGGWSGAAPQPWPPPGAPGPAGPQPWSPPSAPGPAGPQPWSPPGGSPPAPQPWTPPAPVDPPPPPGWVPPPTPPADDPSWPDRPGGPIS